MAVFGVLHFIGILILMSASTLTAIPCGVFEFQSSNISNKTILVNEHSPVNITFILVTQNCSILSFGAIDISKKDLMANMFGRQCSVYEKCKIGPHYHNKSCQCLEKYGFYSFSFIAKREDSSFWKWSTTQPVAKDSVLEIVVKYPSQVKYMEIIGNDRCIPRHNKVSIFCSWENGNPPSEVRLLDRHDKVLTSGNTTGNILYTFHSVDCHHTGTIRCEANGSIKNESVIMLIECPPQVFIPEPRIGIIYVAQNANITFSLLSHETHIICHIYRLKGNTDVNTDYVNGTTFYSCSNLKHYCWFEQRNCLCDVTGSPPDLQLTIQVYNVDREDVGLWYVNVSNSKGGDGMYIQVDNTNSTPVAAFVTAGTTQHQLPNTILTSLTGVVAALTFCILLCTGLYFQNRGETGCTQRLLQQNKADLVLCTRENRIETDGKVVPDSNLEEDNESPQTDFTRTTVGQRARAVLEVFQSRKFLPIRSLSSHRVNPQSEYFECISDPD